EKEVYVATYGSLRRLMGNAHVNKYAGAEFVGLGHTVKAFDIFAYCGGFPSLSLKHNDAKVPAVVDVYKTTEKGLKGPYDGLEGYPSFYNRTLVDINMEDGKQLQAWIYHIDKQTGPLVESGDWCLHKVGENYYEQLAARDRAMQAELEAVQE
ncbi:MAG: gamma-glutamylcyclotransferase family protein, partial [Fusobacteriaceae bacterium]